LRHESAIAPAARRAHYFATRKRATRKLEYIDLATCLEDLKVPPGNRLHELERDRKGQHSIADYH
jgi:plasmid maintenance system killer protein